MAKPKDHAPRERQVIFRNPGFPAQTMDCLITDPGHGPLEITVLSRREDRRFTQQVRGSTDDSIYAKSAV